MGKYEIIQKQDFTVSEMVSIVENSLLVPNTTIDDVTRFMDRALLYGFRYVCLHNNYTEYAAAYLEGTPCQVLPTVAFPFGALTPEAKAAEVERTILRGAGEIDIVQNIGACRSHDWELLYRDMASCAEVTKKYNKTLKVILECCYLTEEEKVMACKIAMKAGVDYVKTSTGFAKSAAVLGDVALMKKVVGSSFGVKAAGPIGDYDSAVAFINAGAHRIGSRRAFDIIKGCIDYQPLD